MSYRSHQTRFRRNQARAETAPAVRRRSAAGHRHQLLLVRRQTVNIVYEQNQTTGRMLVEKFMVTSHWGAWTPRARPAIGRCRRRRRWTAEAQRQRELGQGFRPTTEQRSSRSRVSVEWIPPDRPAGHRDAARRLRTRVLRELREVRSAGGPPARLERRPGPAASRLREVSVLASRSGPRNRACRCATRRRWADRDPSARSGVALAGRHPAHRRWAGPSAT